ncbi:hypothetical protein [Rhizohabitans arisaemae]|uniref:hypothetical protein n=1 Tax=Rhizohabitans arisaemae TaxID=2720610 RepID=UPI0024B1F89B|nr:hypothetical protein [Rhizohabitans arisaemae]
MAAPNEITRTTADGSTVTVALPAGVGAVTWHGSTTIVGHGIDRRFVLGPAGEHQVHAADMPGVRTVRYRRNGFDIALFESGDRSQSFLTWIGLYHEATTWFSGPAPRLTVINRLISSVDFSDSPSGAVLKGKPHLDQYGTDLVAWGDSVFISARDATKNKDLLPTWQGFKRGNEEVWKEKLDLEPTEAAAVAGTAYEWRYIFANPTTIFDMAFRTDPGRMTAFSTESSDAWIQDVLAEVNLSWTG